MYDEKRVIEAIIEKDPISNEYENLVRLARKNLSDGVVVEPRGFYITGAVNSTGLVSLFTDAFLNGEDFPIRITHVTACPRRLTSAGVVQTPITLQRMGMKLMVHDQWYMNADEPLTRIPLWINKTTGAFDITARSQSSWRFDVPFILSAKDSIRVRVALEAAPAQGTSRVIMVGFTGVGLISKRPYFWSGTVDALTDTNEALISSTNFVNDGMEPVAVTDMTVYVSAENTANDPTGNIYFGTIQISQIGNGTQADWFSALDVTANPLCPTGLLGITTGRAAVHKLPGDGFIMEPGSNISLALQQVEGSIVGYQIAVGLFGYIMVS